MKEKYYLKYYSYSIKLIAIFAVLILILTSCEDNGCIEADEFGDYEIQTVIIPSNLNENLCDYDIDNLDAAVEENFKACLTQSTPEIYDIDGKTVYPESNNQGCKGFIDVVNRKICSDKCKQKCLSDVKSALTNKSSIISDPKPNWTTTSARIEGKNQGITIYPNSVINIRAEGQIELTNSNSSNQSKKIDVKRFLPYERSNLRIDVKKGADNNIKIYGSWSDGDGNVYGSYSIPKNPDQNTSNISYLKSFYSSKDSEYTNVLNMGRKLMFYAIPHPGGYTSDISSINEKNINSKVPLYADGDAWRCDHQNPDIMDDPLKTYCESSDYNTIGYLNADNKMSSEAFPITTKAEGKRIRNYGGFLRFNNDNIEASDSDEFSFNKLLNNQSQISECCDISGNYNRSKIDDIFNNQDNKISYDNSDIIDLSSSNSSSFNVKAGSKLYIRNLGYNISNNCDNKWIKISENDNNNFPSSCSSNEQKCVNLSGNNIAVYYKYFDQDTKIFLKSDAGNCTKFIGIHSAKLLKITVPTSGFVSFKIVGANSGSCDIKSSIINQDGSFEDDSSGKIAEINTTVDSNNFSLNTKKYYLKKNQILVFDPNSWKGGWSVNSSILKKCGVGMAFYIEPRPPAICIGNASEDIKNLACNPMLKYYTELHGCIDYASCLDKNSQNFCPTVNIIDSGDTIFPSSSSTDSGNNQKKTCDININCGNEGDQFNSASDCSYSPLDSNYCSTKCTGCANYIMNSRNNIAPFKKYKISQCYSLENYISSYYKFQNAAKGINGSIDDLITNYGLEYLSSNSSDYYSDFHDFEIDSEVVADNNDSSLIYPQFKAKKGVNFDARINFLVLDGDDISYNSYEKIRDTQYGNNISNNFSINITTDNITKNGDNLDVVLCADRNDSSYECNAKDLEEINDINDVKVDEIYIQDPVLSDKSLLNESDYGKIIYNIVLSKDLASTNYYFDKDGNIKRKSPINPNKDCSDYSTDYFCHRFFNKKADDNEGIIAKKNNLTNLLRIGFRINDPDGDYSNNSGYYKVTIKSRIPESSKSSSLIGNIISLVMERIDGSGTVSSVDSNNAENDLDSSYNNLNKGIAAKIYIAFVNGYFFKSLLQFSMIFSFLFFGLGYFIGIVELKQEVIVKLLFKIGFIYLFVNPDTGWAWFQDIFASIFKGGTDFIALNMAAAFNNSGKITEAINNIGTAYGFYDKSILFSSVDDIINLFFSSIAQKKILALFFSQLYGWLYMIIIYYGILIYFYAVANTVLLYLLAQFFTSILFVLGPIFFIFLLFSVTKEMFDNWLKALIGFSLQQIFLVTTISFFNMLLYYTIKSTLGYKICWSPILSYKSTRLLSFWTVAGGSVEDLNQVSGMGTSYAIMPSFYSMFYILVIASLMKKFVSLSTDIAAKISEGIKASNLGIDIAQKFGDMENIIKKTAYSVYNKSIGRVVSSIDESLFDSAEGIKNRKMQDKKDDSDIKILSQYGDNAISQYKINNASELAMMSRDQQKDFLREKKNEAMQQKANEMGINNARFNMLMNKSGFFVNVHGTNLFGAALSVAKQGFKGRLTTSLSQDKIKSTFSQSEAQAAIKNLYNINSDDKEEKINQFIDATGSNVNIKRGHLQYAMDLVKSPRSESYKVAQSAKSFIGNKFNNAYKFFKDPEKTEARKTLEDKGFIARIGSGREVFRSDKEKDLIRENMVKPADLKINLNKSNANAIAELRKFKDGLSEDTLPKIIKGEISRLGNKIFGYNEKRELMEKQADNIPDRIRKEIDIIEERILNNRNNSSLIEPQKNRLHDTLNARKEKLKDFLKIAYTAKNLNAKANELISDNLITSQKKSLANDLKKDYENLTLEKKFDEKKFNKFIKKYEDLNN